jgi:hypothetical protein
LLKSKLIALKKKLPQRSLSNFIQKKKEKINPSIKSPLRAFPTFKESDQGVFIYYYWSKKWDV